MIYRIYEDCERITTWHDSLKNLVAAAHEAAFSERRPKGVRSEKCQAMIEEIHGDWMTMSEEVKEEALRQGYWVQYMGLLGWEIMFGWTTDSNKPPNNSAIHA